MCEQTEINYLDGDVVWVKLGSCWWPGEVVGSDKLPADLVSSFRKLPIAVVKFFQEDTYEYVKNINNIYKYNCSRKNEFINKGLYMYRTKHGHMEKFPEDVIRAETKVGGDIAILTRDEFQEEEKKSYAGIFGSAKKTPDSVKKGRSRQIRGTSVETQATPTKKINFEKSDYKVHILVQGASTPRQSTENATTPSSSQVESEPLDKPHEDTPIPQKISKPTYSNPTVSSSGTYACHACPFTSTRLNVMILHNKTHSSTFIPYTPTPAKKKIGTKGSPKSTPKSNKVEKAPRKLKEKLEKTSKKPQKRSLNVASMKAEVKKPKTDEEIKSSLLADWDDGDDESYDETSTLPRTDSPEVAEGPEVPTPADLPSAKIPDESSQVENVTEDHTNKPEQSSDSKYEFCEDEDWPVEAGVGRKIPRVNNPMRKEASKSRSIDEDEMAREVAELLNKTTVPELPIAPEPVKIEENFPEPAIVKSPDKKDEFSENKKPPEKSLPEVPPSKVIFKTKTFFRSRHSRSQDIIGKYVAEQLNAAERMDTSENEINGSDAVSSPEARESPPVEPVKVARLAPKIQLKKLREKEKLFMEKDQQKELKKVENVEDNFTKDIDANSLSHQTQGPIYPTTEIKPILLEENKIKSIKEHKLIQVKDTRVNKYDQIETNNKNESVNFNQEVTKTQNSVTTEAIASDTSTQNKIGDNVHCVPSPKHTEVFMNESTASAVDALLSVSRETDRVTKIVGDDPPEDLFEDDAKEPFITNNNLNGFNKNDHKDDNLLQNVPLSVQESHRENEEENFENDKSVDETRVTVSEKVATETHSTIEDSNNCINTTDQEPTECDLQIAETLLNLPSTPIQNNTLPALVSNKVPEKMFASSCMENVEIQEEVVQTTEDMVVEDKKLEVLNENPVSEVITEESVASNSDSFINRFETEHEKSENLNAAQSLVQMSESVDHSINLIETNLNERDVPQCLNNTSSTTETKLPINKSMTVQKDMLAANIDMVESKRQKLESSSPKLLKILEDAPKVMTTKPTKKIIVPTKEKILNFDVGKPALKGKMITQSPKQKIIIRRAGPAKTLINSMAEVTTPDRIILSRSNKPAMDGSSVQTYTIKTTPDLKSEGKTILIQQQPLKKITKTVPPKLQKIKPQTSLVASLHESKESNVTMTDDIMFDINSMPIVLSDDILTAENIEKMPVVISDCMTNQPVSSKVVKPKPTIIENEKVVISPVINKPEMKTLLVNPLNDGKASTPNILSKSSKLRTGGKPMLVIDKTTGKQKLIMTKHEPSVTREVKQMPAKVQSGPSNASKTEKFILLPSSGSPRTGRTQKIIIDPQTGKAHVLVAKTQDIQQNISENKPVSAKCTTVSESSNTGNAVMIITNAQGAQSRIVLTPEHEKILFPNKQQPSTTQVKTITHRITTGQANQQKTIVSSGGPKTPTRIVPKQKSAIITSKGQLIVGGKIATSAQNIAPMPQIRPATKRIITSEPKKIIQTVQKAVSEPLIFWQQKPGAVMQLTAAQFEHLQKTGQIIQKVPALTQENRIDTQKSITISSNEPIVPIIQKQKIKRTFPAAATPAKKAKHIVREIVSINEPVMPPLTSISNNSSTVTSFTPAESNMISLTTTQSHHPHLENFEELLPSTAIVRRQEPIIDFKPSVVVNTPIPEPVPPQQEAAAPISDGQLLAAPGEHFGGPPGSFYLCVEDNGMFTAIDNRPLVLENNHLVPMADPIPALVQPERRDILEAALANSDVFHPEPVGNDAPDFRDLNANVSVHCRVSETSSTLNQPIMTPIEVPSKGKHSEPTVTPSNLEDGLAVIGVTPHTVPTSLELPITVTDPRIAPKTTDPLSNNNYGTSLLQSPNTEIAFVTDENEVTVGPISMPLLTEDDSVGKSMPILTDDVTERTASSTDSTLDSPASLEARESEEIPWSRRLLTPNSDTSETSAEIPLQPILQLSVSDMSQHS